MTAEFQARKMATFFERQIIDEVANIIVRFLPMKSKDKNNFISAASEARLGYVKKDEKKIIYITNMLLTAYEYNKEKFSIFLLSVVKRSIVWRNSVNKPLTNQELYRVNELIGGLSIQIPEFSDPGFLSSLSPKIIFGDSKEISLYGSGCPDPIVLAGLRKRFGRLQQLPGQERGYEFEIFLVELFSAHNMSPKRAFRNKGEQIDGSFLLEGEVYLLEAKWQGPKIGISDLLTFSGKVSRKAQWSRGVLISCSGFSEDGLFAFSSGQATNIVCIDGYDLYQSLCGKPNFKYLVCWKVRRAAETNRAFVSVQELI